MEYILIPLVSFLASGLTFFSGFGLGTVLLPAFAVFFPIEVSVAMTAVVHFLNNIFKFFLVRRYVVGEVVARFGIPALIASFAGAWVLVLLSELQPLFRYQFLSREFTVQPANFLFAFLIAIFATLELLPSFGEVAFGRKYMPLGGILSGFFGGLSGHQGAFRSAFLLQAGLSKEGFIASGIAVALLVDTSRLFVYGLGLSSELLARNLNLLGAAIAAAFLGGYTGRRLMMRFTLRRVRFLVSAMLFLIAFGMATGFV